MMHESGKVKDPVCEMWVAPEQNAVNYQGLHFAFCSQQCKERFLANPHLYIGLPGEPAPKKSVQKVVKRRRLRLETPLSDADAPQLIKRLEAMMGVEAVEIEADELTITYDLLQATVEQIEAVLQQARIHTVRGITTMTERQVRSKPPARGMWTPSSAMHSLAAVHDAESRGYHAREGQPGAIPEVLLYGRTF